VGISRSHNNTPLNASRATNRQRGLAAANAIEPSSTIENKRPPDETIALTLARWSWLRE
jgi:hypothetical protein